MPHQHKPRYDYDEDAPPRSERPRRPLITLDIEAAAMRAAYAIKRAPPDQREILERLFVERLLERIEERHEARDVDAVCERFAIALRAQFEQ